MIVAVTGHRPPKLGGYSKETFARLVRFAEMELLTLKPTKVKSGMALGWDMAVALASSNLSIPFTACIPCDSQESRWPHESQMLYHTLLGLSEDSIVVCPGPYAAWKMQVRNQHLVDVSTDLLALHDGSSGGTGNCVDYAIQKHRNIINCWERWVAFQ